MRRCLIVVALMLVVALPAHATDVRLGGDLAWVRDSSFDAFQTSDVLGRLDVCLGYTVLTPAWVRLDAELGYGYTGTSTATATFAGIESSLSVHDVYAGVRASVDLQSLWWVRPYVRLQGGVAFGSASFRDTRAAGGPTYEDLSAAGLVYSGGGLEFVLPLSLFLVDPPVPLSEPMAFGIFVEGGYLFRSGLSFDPSIPPPEDEEEAADRIPVQGFSAGDVLLSGGHLRFGFLVRL